MFSIKCRTVTKKKSEIKGGGGVERKRDVCNISATINAWYITKTLFIEREF